MDSTNLIHMIIGGMSSAILGLVSGILILWRYTKQIQKSHNDELKEHLEKMTNAFVNNATAILTNTKAIESNTKVMDDVQKLVQAVNIGVVELKVRNKE